MSDLPPELLDRLAHRLNDDWNAYLRTVGRTDLMVPEEWTDNARSFLAALAEWADGALIDPATWTRWDRKEQPATPLCPVHGDAACPEEYMLKSNGEPWAHYAEAWSETARCGRRPTVPLSTLTPRED